jgi:hypothetical protein
MMEKVLSWQEKYDTPESRAQTAAMMLDNDPNRSLPLTY